MVVHLVSLSLDTKKPNTTVNNHTTLDVFSTCCRFFLSREKPHVERKKYTQNSPNWSDNLSVCPGHSLPDTKMATVSFPCLPSIQCSRRSTGATVRIFVWLNGSLVAPWWPLWRSIIPGSSR